MSKVDELKAVLELPEKDLDENRAILQPQYAALYKYQEENEYFDLPHPDCTLGGDKTNMFLADLAFRLRDEAIKKNITYWQRAMDKVFLAVYKDEIWQETHPFERWSAVVYYFSHKAKPIHWIIAALIAKDLAKDNK